MPLPIQDGGRLSQLLQDLLSIQGRIQPSLEDFVLPVVQLGDLSIASKPPVRRSCSATDFIGAVALERAMSRLEVPGGVVANIKKIIFASSGGTQMDVVWGLNILAADIPTITAGVFTDNRLTLGAGAAQIPAGRLAIGTRVAALTPQWTQKLPTDGILVVEPDGWVIGTGTNEFGGIEIAGDTVNTSVNLTMEWDEYQLF